MFMFNKILRSAFNIFLNYKIMMFILADVFVLINDTITFQNHIVQVMQNLNEGIITKTSDGLGFCNTKALVILKQVKTSGRKQKSA